MIDLSTLASSTLVAIYNRLVPDASSDEMPLAQVKKFSDKSTAVKRVTNILADVNKVREIDGRLPFIVSEDGSVVTVSETAAPSTGSEPVVPSTGSDELDGLRDSGALDARVSEERLEDIIPSTTKPSSEVIHTETDSETPKVDVSITKSRAKSGQPRAKAPSRRSNTASMGRPMLVGPTDIISLIHRGNNPKRAEAARRFAKYRDGMTVQEYIDAVGVKRQALRDIAWDMKMEWITISGAPRTKKVDQESASGQVEAASDAAPEAPVEQTDQAA